MEQIKLQVCKCCDYTIASLEGYPAVGGCIYVVLFPDPTNPSADRFQYRAREGGSGDICHIFVF